MRIGRFETFGMMCPACPRMLERMLERVPGVQAAVATITSGTTVVVYDRRVTDELKLAASICRWGFGVRVAVLADEPSL